MLRRVDDSLAWEAIRATPPGDAVKVALLGSDRAPAEADGLDVVTLGADYDGVVALIEWSDKVVTW